MCFGRGVCGASSQVLPLSGIAGLWVYLRRKKKKKKMNKTRKKKLNL